jgi:DeoR/GlpR family transcriptional regulator of sugar metabolism
VSASGLSGDGASTTEVSEAAMKQELLKRAAHTVLLADARKWNRAATVQFAAWSELEIWISDAPDEAVAEIEKLGPRVLCAR